MTEKIGKTGIIDVLSGIADIFKQMEWLYQASILPVSYRLPDTYKHPLYHPGQAFGSVYEWSA